MLQGGNIIGSLPESLGDWSAFCILWNIRKSESCIDSCKLFLSDRIASALAIPYSLFCELFGSFSHIASEHSHHFYTSSYDICILTIPYTFSHSWELFFCTFRESILSEKYKACSVGDIVSYASKIVFSIVFVIVVIEDSRKKLCCTVSISRNSEFYPIQDSITRIFIIFLISIKPWNIAVSLFVDIPSIRRGILDHKRYDRIIWVLFIPPFTHDIDSGRDVCSHTRIPIISFCSESGYLPSFVFCELSSYDTWKSCHRSIYRALVRSIWVDKLVLIILVDCTDFFWGSDKCR